MSTQRRANRMNRTRALNAPDTRISFAVASVKLPLAGTNESLLQDPRLVPLVSHTHPSLKKAGPRATRRYSSPAGSPRTDHRLRAADPISIPSDSSKSHPASPQAPADNRRRAERHDGKRDLYLQHAA